MHSLSHGLTTLSDEADCSQTDSASPAVSPSEPGRLEALRRYSILDTVPEASFDRITRLVATTFQAPIVRLTFVDAERDWSKSWVGSDLQEPGRASSFCQYSILSDQVMVVPDARTDARFRDNPLVTGAPHARFYAGAPLKTSDGFILGTFPGGRSRLSGFRHDRYHRVGTATSGPDHRGRRRGEGAH